MKIIRKIKTRLKQIYLGSLSPLDANRIRYRDEYRAFVADQPDWAAEVGRNQVFKNKYAGQRCFIVGNGPSLRGMDLSALRSEHCFCVNFSHRLEAYSQIQPEFHVLADTKMFEDGTPSNAQFKELCAVLSKQNHHTDLFLCGDTHYRMNPISPNVELYYFRSSAVPLLEDPEWEIDFTKPISSLFNVVQYALEAAIYMGFSSIYLIGCDATDFLNAAMVKTGKDYGVHAYKEDATSYAKIRDSYHMENAFHSFYSTFRDYRLLYEYCCRKGIRLINCTVGGVLDSIPRQNFEDVLSNTTAVKPREEKG